MFLSTAGCRRHLRAGGKYTGGAHVGASKKALGYAEGFG